MRGKNALQLLQTVNYSLIIWRFHPLRPSRGWHRGSSSFNLKQSLISCLRLADGVLCQLPCSQRSGPGPLVWLSTQAMAGFFIRVRIGRDLQVLCEDMWQRAAISLLSNHSRHVSRSITSAPLSAHLSSKATEPSDSPCRQGIISKATTSVRILPKHD